MYPSHDGILILSLGLVCQALGSMMGKPGTCLFKFSTLAIPPIATCLAIYVIFGGPPPTTMADIGMKVLLITSIAQALVSIVCIISLKNNVKSICYFLVCDLGLLIVFVATVYTSYSLHNIKLGSKCMKKYTQEHVRQSGYAPPFLDTIQEHMSCCGIDGVEDYIDPIIESYKDRHSKDSSDPFEIPLTCCKSSVSTQLRSNCRSENAKNVRRVLDGGQRMPATFGLVHFDYEKGCGAILNSTESFMASLPNNYWRWAFLPLQLKNGYLRLMVIWSGFLLVLFNYRAIQARRSLRRPALIPRAPPISYDNPVAQYPFLSTDGLDISINVAPQFKREMGNHPFMLSAMVHPRTNAAVVEPCRMITPQSVDSDNNNVSPDHVCPRCATLNANNVVPRPDYPIIPTAPPPPPYSL